MAQQIYQCGTYKVFRAKSGFIVFNTLKPFENGHAHIEKYETCMVLIRLSKNKRVPSSRSRHFIESLLRISSGQKYVREIRKYLEQMEMQEILKKS